MYIVDIMILDKSSEDTVYDLEQRMRQQLKRQFFVQKGDTRTFWTLCGNNPATWKN